MQLKKGINIGVYLSQHDHSNEQYEYFLNEQTIRQIHDWGFDHFRMTFDYSLVLDDEGVIVPEGIELLRAAILLGQKYGLNVILNLHKTFECKQGFIADITPDIFFLNEVALLLFRSLWHSLANTLGSYKNVAFELLSEVVETENAEGWDAVIADTAFDILEEAPQVTIIYGGIKRNSAATLKHLSPPGIDNIIFCFHIHEPNCIKEMISKAVAAAQKAGVPLYCGEFGVIHKVLPEEGLRSLDDLLSLFQENDIGYAMWPAYGAKHDGGDLFVPGCRPPEWNPGK